VRLTKADAMQLPPFFSNHENNGLLVKLKPIHHLNESAEGPKPKMLNFEGFVSQQKQWKRKT
jgi:hypothetical protein